MGLRFLVIGAQKGGTTSLFEYMRRHPEIHMPANKEISFFDRNYGRGENWYLSTALRNARPGAVCGEASVGYMSGTPFGDRPGNEQWSREAASSYEEPLEDVIPRRIKLLNPDVKLICVLRDPVERAFSHYSMACLDKAESRSFDDAIAALLEPDALEGARTVPMGDNGYVVNGEYGRVLAGYLRTFPAEQLMVIFSDDLARTPVATLASAFGFVGVDDGYMPENLDTRYRAAALEHRIGGLDLYAWQRRLAYAQRVRGAWRKLPQRVRDKIGWAYSVASFRVEMWNARRGGVGQEISPPTRQRLIEHFRADSEALASLIGREIPWLAEWTS